jgi:hypothetical protein
MSLKIVFGCSADWSDPAFTMTLVQFCVVTYVLPRLPSTESIFQQSSPQKSALLFSGVLSA